MFNVFSKAFLDKKNIGKNASATSNALLKPSNTTFLSKNISENARGENEKTKHMSLKERLASVRNAQNVMGKTNSNTNANVNVTNNAETAVKEKPLNELKKGPGSEVALPHFKKYATIMNERNVDRQNEEEMEKRLKKRKRRKKHEMEMERMKQQGKEKYGDHEDNNNEEDEEEEPNNSTAAEEVKKRRPGRPSKNKQEERQRQEEKRRQEEEDEEEERYQNNSSQHNDNYRNSVNSVNNRNSAVSNHDGEPVKQKRKRRKKKEMEALRAQGLIGKGPNSQNSLNRNSAGTGNATNNTGQEENKVKRRRGRPKLRGNTQNNVSNDKSKSNDSSKGTDIRKYWSKNDDDDNNNMNNNNVGTNGNIMRTESNNYAKENDRRREPSERGGGNKQRNIFNIITSARENDGFMKKTPSEIENLERSYKNNVKSGVTCIPLNYQENGGGMCIIFIDTDTEYGPIKNYHGFMTFLVLECDPEQFFIETGITHNVIECEKHMQLLISPGDTYTFKNNSRELEAKLLLIACNKMTVPLDLKNHIRDPTMTQEKG